MLSSYVIILYISIVTAVCALTQPTVQFEISPYVDDSVDHSSSNCNRENGIFLSTYSTRGRRKKMEDFFVSSQDCCFAGILRSDAFLQLPNAYLIWYLNVLCVLWIQLLHNLRCALLSASSWWFDLVDNTTAVSSLYCFFCNDILLFYSYECRI